MNEHERDPYNVLSRFYDLEFDSFDADLEMYRQFARSLDGPVLELGCGSGRVLLALQDLGLPLTGVDNSTSMLERARQRLEPTVSLLQRDFRNLHPIDDAPFAFVFCAVNTLLHLPDAESQLMALESIERVTRPQGALMVDILVPDPQYLSSIDGRVEMELDTMLEDGSRLTKWTTRTHDMLAQAIYTTAYYDVIQPDGAVTRAVGEYTTRYIHLSELEHLYARTGWEIVSVYGGYDLEPVDPDSERFIVLATPGRRE